MGEIEGEREGYAMSFSSGLECNVACKVEIRVEQKKTFCTQLFKLLFSIVNFNAKKKHFEMFLIDS